MFFIKSCFITVVITFTVAVQAAATTTTGSVLVQPDQYLKALKDGDYKRLNELATNKSANLSDQFYREAFRQLYTRQYDTALGEAVLNVVKLVDYFNALEQHVHGRLLPPHDDGPVITPGEIVDADDLIDDLLVESLRCEIAIKNDPTACDNHDDDDNLDDSPHYLHHDDDKQQMFALLLKGTGKFVEEAFLFMVSAVAYFHRAHQHIADPHAFFTVAVEKCHTILKRLQVKGTCWMVLAMVHQGRLLVWHVGPAGVRLECPREGRLFETTNQGVNELVERLSAEVDGVRVRSYQSVTISVKAGHQLAVSLADSESDQNPVITMTFS